MMHNDWLFIELVALISLRGLFLPATKKMERSVAIFFSQKFSSWLWAQVQAL